MTRIGIHRWRRRVRNPQRWSLIARRLFLVTAPVSLPAWLVLRMVLFALVRTIGGIEPLADLWNAPPVEPGGYASRFQERRARGEQGQRDDGRVIRLMSGTGNDRLAA